MAMHVPIGGAPYGQYRDARSGASFATWFYFLAYLPVIPLWGLQMGRAGAYQRAPMRGRSVAFAYLRAYGLMVAAIFTWLACARLAFGEPIGWFYALCGVAVAVVTVTSWFRSRGLKIRRRWLMGLAYAVPIAAIGVATINEAHGHAEFLARQERELRERATSSPEQRLAQVESRCRAKPGYDCLRAGEMLIEKAPERAVSLLQLGCANRDGQCCTKLGDIYEYGRGVPVNPTLAIEWLDKACKVGEYSPCRRATYLRENQARR
jgi:Sel1 repeat